MLLFLFGISVHLIKKIRVSQKRAETGLCAKEDRPSAIVNARKILRVRVAEDPSAEGDEAWDRFWFSIVHVHSFIVLLPMPKTKIITGEQSTRQWPMLHRLASIG